MNVNRVVVALECIAIFHVPGCFPVTSRRPIRVVVALRRLVARSRRTWMHVRGWHTHYTGSHTTLILHIHADRQTDRDRYYEDVTQWQVTGISPLESRDNYRNRIWFYHSQYWCIVELRNLYLGRWSLQHGLAGALVILLPQAIRRSTAHKSINSICYTFWPLISGR